MANKAGGSGREFRANNAFVIFALCVLGSVTALSAIGGGKISTDAGGKLCGTVLTVIMPAAALLLSSSLLGIILVPLCSFCFGLLLCCTAYSMLSSGDFCVSALMPYLLSVPVFFIAASWGMANSSVLCAAFKRSGQRLRSVWLSNFAMTLMSVAAATLFVCLLKRT